MPKKQEKEKVKAVVEETPVVEEKPKKQSGNAYEVAEAFKNYSSFLLNGGVVIPVQDGKVTVASDALVTKMRKGGFIK